MPGIKATCMKLYHNDNMINDLNSKPSLFFHYSHKELGSQSSVSEMFNNLTRVLRTVKDLGKLQVQVHRYLPKGGLIAEGILILVLANKRCQITALSRKFEFPAHNRKQLIFCFGD